MLDIILYRTGTSDRDFFQDYYVQMWTRFPPYLLGILLGWFLYYTKGKKIKMNKVTLLLSNIKNKCIDTNFVILDGCCWRMVDSYSYGPSYPLWTDTLPRSNHRSNNRRRYKSVFRSVQSFGLGSCGRLGHICLHQWLWRYL